MQLQQTIDFTTASPMKTSNFSLPLYQGCGYNQQYTCWSINEVGGFFRFNLNLPLKSGVSITFQLCSSIAGGVSDCPISIQVNGQNLVTNFDPHIDTFYNKSWYIPAGMLNAGDNEITMTLAGGTTKVFMRYATVSMPMVNAWLFLNEDEPCYTTPCTINYNSPNSCYQTLIQNNIYQSINLLYLCFVTTTPTGANTVPAGDGSSYTLQMGASSHPGGLTNQDYMNYILRDARKNNPNIKIAVTLVWGDGSVLSNIFSNTKYSPQQNADNFAANLMAYLKYYNLDGFDIDWESPLSDQTTQEQFKLLINAIGAQFRQQTAKQYYLTLSPAEVGNLDAAAVNNNVSFINLQLYSGFTYPQDFINAGVNAKLFAYGAKFEADEATTNPNAPGDQTAQQAYSDNQQNYQFSIFTNWRLNSQNYLFEQGQQQQLYQLVFPAGNSKSKASSKTEKENVKKQEQG